MIQGLPETVDPYKEWQLREAANVADVERRPEPNRRQRRAAASRARKRSVES
jgi:hypothetical protein